ncbi:MAG: neutral zinc metallopeptidase [Acidobacteriota bacterium]|nr:neutral zinc metallopeptidase [Acidobacteriota bacterium]
MQWTPGGVSKDIEDRRDDSGGGGGFGGFGGGGFGGVHLGIGGTLILLVLSFLFKTNLFQFFGGGGAESQPSQIEQRAADPQRSQAERPEVLFVSFVLDDVQKNWDKTLPQSGRPYHHARLVLFRDAIESPCGLARSATGPFYCPGDEKVYVDLGFFDELKTRFGAPGEFAQAYVLAHEIGHHVQKILGIEAQVRRAQERNPELQNPLSVKLELQADCLAGVWANSTEQRNLVNQNDIAAGLRAAAAVGDDRLQRMARGRVSPETFTHGSSADRMHWFQQGLNTGTVSGCNTFANR